MKKTIIASFIIAMIVVGCKKVEVDFTYAPTAPRAGQSITFSNTSSGGESWLWNFGDND